jgi:hypothetical protein
VQKRSNKKIQQPNQGTEPVYKKKVKKKIFIMPGGGVEPPSSLRRAVMDLKDTIRWGPPGAGCATVTPTRIS